MTTEDQQVMDWAKTRARQLGSFYRHLASFVLVSAVLVVIDVATGGEGRFLRLDWAFWPIGGWGVGIVAHAVSTFTMRSGAGWEERKAQDLYRSKTRQTGSRA